MNPKRLNQIARQTHVKYGDLSGIVKIDLKDSISSLYSICEKYGFDRDKNFIVGFKISEETINGISSEKTRISILYTEGQNYEEALSKIKEDRLIKKENIYVEYSELAQIIKRLNATVTTKILDDIDFEIED